MDLFSFDSLVALVTLTAMEIVLGIDNIVFLAILTGRLPESQRARARRIGLTLAMGMRILLLVAIKWVMGLTAPLFQIGHFGMSGRDLILLGGGLFLLAKATHEVHERTEGGAAHGAQGPKAAAAGFGATVGQIVAIDLVFSLDSVITAVGMAESLLVMIAAVVLAIAVMMLFAGKVSDFVERHPTIKMLALAFLLLIGVMLVAESFHRHIERGYIYFAMAFSLGVEMLNIRSARRTAAAHG